MVSLLASLPLRWEAPACGFDGRDENEMKGEDKCSAAAPLDSVLQTGRRGPLEAIPSVAVVHANDEDNGGCNGGEGPEGAARAAALDPRVVPDDISTSAAASPRAARKVCECSK